MYEKKEGIIIGKIRYFKRNELSKKKVEKCRDKKVEDENVCKKKGKDDQETQDKIKIL